MLTETAPRRSPGFLSETVVLSRVSIAFGLRSPVLGGQWPWNFLSEDSCALPFLRDCATQQNTAKSKSPAHERPGPSGDAVLLLWLIMGYHGILWAVNDFLGIFCADMAAAWLAGQNAAAQQQVNARCQGPDRIAAAQYEEKQQMDGSCGSGLRTPGEILFGSMGAKENDGC